MGHAALVGTESCIRSWSESLGNPRNRPGHHFASDVQLCLLKHQVPRRTEVFFFLSTGMSAVGPKAQPTMTTAPSIESRKDAFTRSQVREYKIRSLKGGSARRYAVLTLCLGRNGRR